jgi:hypothetical protein
VHSHLSSSSNEIGLASTAHPYIFIDPHEHVFAFLHSRARGAPSIDAGALRGSAGKNHQKEISEAGMIADLAVSGSGFLFGMPAVETFCHRNRLRLITRSSSSSWTAFNDTTRMGEDPSAY